MTTMRTPMRPRSGTRRTTTTTTPRGRSSISTPILAAPPIRSTTPRLLRLLLLVTSMLSSSVVVVVVDAEIVFRAARQTVELNGVDVAFRADVRFNDAGLPEAQPGGEPFDWDGSNDGGGGSGSGSGNGFFPCVAIGVPSCSGDGPGVFHPDRAFPDCDVNTGAETLLMTGKMNGLDTTAVAKCNTESGKFCSRGDDIVFDLVNAVVHLTVHVHNEGKGYLYFSDDPCSGGGPTSNMPPLPPPG